MNNEDFKKTHGKDYYDIVEYKGTSFVVDYFDDGLWLVTEQSFMSKGKGKTLEEAKQNAFRKYDELMIKIKQNDS